MSNLDKFTYWINERYAIYLRKEIHKLNKPWSEDPVFQNTYFCNVHRENDRVTRWIRQNFPLGFPIPEFNMIVARFVNKPSSLELMGWPFHKWEEVEETDFLFHMSQKGSWGSAYIVSTNGRAMPKHEYISGLLSAACEQLSAKPLPTTCLAASAALRGIQGLASFMSGQIVADLKNTVGHPLSHATDWWTFVAPGPGSLRGMTWIYGDPNEGKDLKARDFHRCMPYLRKQVDQDLEYSWIPRFCNQDLQNCLCEFDKYMRVSTGSGRSKRKYNGKNSL